MGLVALSALVFAVPTEAQTVTVPGPPVNFSAYFGDGRVRLSWGSPADAGGVHVTTLTYQYRYAPGAAVPDATAWSTAEPFPQGGSVILAGLANGTAYAFEVRVSFTDDLNSAEGRKSDGTAGNSVPTASAGRVTAIENQDYTFTAADFNYADADGDPLASVTIEYLPASGTLKLANANVRVDATVIRAQLDAGSLTYTPPTDQTGTGVAFFLFAVSDGITESTSVYRIDIDITEDTIAPGRPRTLTAVHGLGVRRAHLHAHGHRAGGRAAHVRGAGGEQLDPE